MSEALFSPQWYRVARLVPQLRSHVQLHRHQYRGQTWYVLQDGLSEKVHRFSPTAYALIGLMDGRRTVQDLWERSATRLGDEALTQPEIVQLLSDLHAADVLQCSIPPDTAELLHRAEQSSRRRCQKRLASVMAWQIPLLDPERLLQVFNPLVRPLWSRWGAALWLLLVGPALLLGVTHWTELTADLLDRLTTPQNLLWLWLLFPVIKACHEFGHAFAVKAFGGEVHEMGVMVLVFSPIPYVDASAASVFPNKWQRITVGAAGMLVEGVLAALALYVWVTVEPGLIRTLAYNTIFIAGISTLVFNANPLLRFDGYYMLADWLEIPNLRQRATKDLVYLCERYLFGRQVTPPHPPTPRERPWLIGYTLSSFVYRLVVFAGILLYLMDQFFLMGVLCALLMGGGWFLVPIGKMVHHVGRSPRLREVRGRAITVSAALGALVLLLLTLVPMPFRTRAEGVVWMPDEAYVRAEVEGFVETVVVSSGSLVKAGEILVVCRDPILEAEVARLEAQRHELQARARKLWREDPVQAANYETELHYLEERLVRARQRQEDLLIRSQTAGTFVLARANDWPGRFVTRGALVGHVVNLDRLTVRTLIEQGNIDLIRQETQGVALRVADRVGEPLVATIARMVPAASEQLPSPALGTEGGGEVPLDPQDPRKEKAMKRVFQVDLVSPLPQRELPLGGRVYVRFDHGRRALAAQWYLHARQLFLARYHV